MRLLDRKFESAVGAQVGSLWVVLPPPAPHFHTGAMLFSGIYVLGSMVGTHPCLVVWKPLSLDPSDDVCSLINLAATLWMPHF